AMKELSFNELRIIEHGGLPMSMQDGADAVGLMLNRWPDVDAVFFAADSAAFGALMECQRRGLRVPQDIAIAGFGDYEISSICHPRITTINVDCYGIGKQAAARLLAALQNGNETTGDITLTEYRVVLRES